MRRIVLPFVTALIDTVSTLNVINAVASANIGVAIEIVIPVDVDVVASPAAVPAPAAAAPRCADRHSDPE